MYVEIKKYHIIYFSITKYSTQKSSIAFFPACFRHTRCLLECSRYTEQFKSLKLHAEAHLHVWSFKPLTVLCRYLRLLKACFRKPKLRPTLPYFCVSETSEKSYKIQKVCQVN